MAELLIDTSDSERIVVGIKKNGREFKIVHASKVLKSQALLPLIEKQLQKHSLKISDIKEIEVNSGPGSFTGLRVGISIANSLGWTLGIKVNGKNIIKDGPLEPLYS